MGLQARLSDGLFRLVAGPDGVAVQQRIHGNPGPRLFERSAPISRVHSDVSMYIGGLRALMVQSLHPAPMRAVHEHSGFRGDMWGRLARTSTFIATTTFGAKEDVEATVATVRRIHDHVNGVLPDGTPYSASDPHLLAWVHIAEIDSFLAAHQVFGRRPLSDSEIDDYVAQTGVIARMLGVMDPPSSYAELQAELQRFQPELRGTPEAVAAISHVRLRPPLTPVARPGYQILWTAAIGLLTDWQREQLRLSKVSPAVSKVAGRTATTALRWVSAPSQRRAREIELAARRG